MNINSVTGGTESLDEVKFAAVAIDVVCFRIADGELQMLVGEVTNSSFAGRMAHIGGLMHVDEDADQTADRLLRTKAGISAIYKEQIHTFSRVDRDPRGRVVAIAYMALTHDMHIQDTGSASRVTQWVPVLQTGLAYDHDEITAYTLNTLKQRIQYSDVAKHLIHEEFTLTELQKVYQVILGEGIDKRNFRKKMLSTDILQSLDKKQKKGTMRPAELYRFK